MKKRKGFTLIELLIVIGIIAILAAIIFVAVDPARRLAEARNAERWSSVNSLLNAVLKYTVDNSGTLPTALTSGVETGTYGIGTRSSDGGCVICPSSPSFSPTTTSNCVDLTSALVPTYIASIPLDPASSNVKAEESGYYIYRSSAGRLTVGACEPETIGGTTPSVSVSR